LQQRRARVPLSRRPLPDDAFRKSGPVHRFGFHDSRDELLANAHTRREVRLGVGGRHRHVRVSDHRWRRRFFHELRRDRRRSGEQDGEDDEQDGLHWLVASANIMPAA